MGDKRNYAALDWVIGEIGETLNEARQSLEAFVEDPRDTARIRFCLTHIHQVHGSLQMVEFHGASLFAEEMESLAEALMQGEVTNEKEAQEALMRSLLQLPIYLEQVKNQQEDHPGAVLPLLNDLRAVRKQSYLSETNLFNPDLSSIQQVRGSRHAVLEDISKLKQIIHKLREMYQFAAASVLRGVKIDDNLTFIEKVLVRMEGLTRGTLCHPTWQVSAALSEALVRDEVELSIAVRGLLRYVARELRILEEHCPAALDAPARESLLRNLLYYVARAEEGGSRVAQVKRQFSLDKALLGGASAAPTSQRGLVSPPEPDAIRSVVVALQDELNTCKHLLDAALSGQGSLSDIEQMMPFVKRIADTLAVLGIGEMRKQMMTQYDALAAISDAGSYDDIQLIDIAGALANVENRLEAIAKGAGKIIDFSNVDERAVEIDSAKEAVLAECRTGLEVVKAAIVESLSSQWDPSHLPHAVETLHRVKGGLGMVPLERSANILHVCGEYIHSRLVDSLERPKDGLQTLADAIASVDYYLELLAEGHGDNIDSYLDLAEDCLTQLGYEFSPRESSLADAASLPSESNIDLEEAAVEQPEGEHIELPDSDATEPEDQTVTADQSPYLPAFDADNRDPDPVSSDETGFGFTQDSVSDDIVIPVEEPVEPEVLETPEEEPAAEIDITEEIEPVAPAAMDESSAQTADEPVAEEEEADEDSLIDDEIIEIFVEEAAEVQETLAEYFPKWRDNQSDQEALTTVRRAFHTLKGSGRMVEALDVGELAWSIENMLNRVLDGTVSPGKAHSRIIELVLEMVPDLVHAFEKSKPNPDPQRHAQLMAWANALSEGGVPSELESGTFDFTPEAAADEVADLVEDDADDDNEDQVLWEIFSSEANTHLAEVDKFLADMAESAPIYSPPTDSLQRALHTLKGSAHMAAVVPIASLITPLEGFVKELRSYQVKVNPDILQLIEDAGAYTREGLNCIAEKREVVIPKLEQFQARVQELFDRHVAPLIHLQEQGQAGHKAVDPKLLAVLMAEEMGLLLDADRIIASWSDATENPLQEKQSIIAELNSLASAAQQANLPDMSELAECLSSVHQAYLHNPSEPSHTALMAGHENLLDMVDQVAAGQDVKAARAEVLSDLRQLIENAPAALSEETFEQVSGTADSDGYSDFPFEAEDSFTAAELIESPESEGQAEEHQGQEEDQDAEETLLSAEDIVSIDDDDSTLVAEESVDLLVEDGEEGLTPDFDLSEDAGDVAEDEIEAFDAGSEESLMALLANGDDDEAKSYDLDSPVAESTAEEIPDFSFEPIEPSNTSADAEEDEELDFSFDGAGQNDASDETPEDLRFDLSDEDSVDLLAGDDSEGSDELTFDVADLSSEESTEGVEEAEASFVLDEEPVDLLAGDDSESSDELTFDPADVSAEESTEDVEEEAEASFVLDEEPVDLQAGDDSESSNQLTFDAVDESSEESTEDAEEELETSFNLDEEPVDLLAGDEVESSDELTFDVADVSSEETTEDAEEELETSFNLDEEPVDLLAGDEVESSDEMTFDAADESSDESTEDAEEELETSFNLDEEPVDLLAGDEVESSDELTFDVADVSSEESTEDAEEELETSFNLDEEPVELLADDEVESSDELTFDVADLSSEESAESVEEELESSFNLSEEPVDLLAGDDSESSDELTFDVSDSILEEGTEATEEEIEITVEDTENSFPLDDEPIVELQDELQGEIGELGLVEETAKSDPVATDEQDFGLDYVLGDSESELPADISMTEEIDLLAGDDESAELELLDDYEEEPDSVLEAELGGEPLEPELSDASDERTVEPVSVLDSESVAPSEAVAMTIAELAYIAEDDFDTDILEIFLEEAGELVEELDEAIHDWESDWDNQDSSDTMKRALHTLKGGARLSGLKNLGELTHEYESYLIQVGGPQGQPDFFAKVLAFQDRVHIGVKAVKAKLEGAPLPEETSSPRKEESDVTSTAAAEDLSQSAEQAHETLEDLSSERDGIENVADVTEAESSAAEEHDEAGSEEQTSAPDLPAMTPPERGMVVPFARKPEAEEIEREFSMPAAKSESNAPQQTTAKRSGSQEMIKVSADLLEELVNLAGETSISRGRLEQQISDLSGAVDEVDGTLGRLNEQLRRLDIETEAQVLFRQEQMAAHEDFDPLEMDRYSQLQQLTRSLMESASDLMDLKSTLTDKIKDTETLLLQQSRVNSALQEGLMRSRMVPFSRLVPRLRRIVRQVAGELGKHVNFELDNVEGEMDRSVLERMVAPLEHMLRNAVDHGIEMPDVRVAQGKPETGRILLGLSREGGDILLRLADDGHGIYLDRVREKAIERGLMAEDANLSDHAVMQFILQAGFSTAENVTQISGRGVGMDVVASEIKQLGGSIVIDSKSGVGSQFTVRLPFTVSVNRALMVQIGAESYAIPLNTIEGIVRVSPFELEHYYSQPDARFEYAGENYQVRHLGAILNDEPSPKFDGQALPLPVILVRSAQNTMALQVDGLMGSREIVVKSLGPQFAAVQGISGATVMGDGSVVVILDPHALVRREIALASAPPAKLEASSNEPKEEAASHKTIMVVDDSVTVRKVTTRFLEREGFNVITAKDGVDALQVLQETVPDLMLLDIEMPRMDGFEVAKNIRSSSRLKHLPIIMITSRTGDKHRQHALSIGVNEYVGKPYQEERLLKIMDSLLNKAKERA